MFVAHFPADQRPRWPHAVAALGNFDGVHRGHQKILDRVCRQAAERGGTPVVVTFDPHPPRVVRPDKAPPLLMTLDQKIEAFRNAGIQGVPSFALQGHVLFSGAVPAEEMAQNFRHAWEILKNRAA